MTIDQFGDPIRPPFPCFEELLSKVPGKEGFLNSPLFHIQGGSWVFFFPPVIGRYNSLFLCILKIPMQF